MKNYKKYFLFLIYILKSLFNPKTLRNNNLLGFMETISKKKGIEIVEKNSIIDWSERSLYFKKIPFASGHVTIQELSIICAFVSKLKTNQNFLEIGTFEGVTSLNCASNAKNITVFTLDLPYTNNTEEFQSRGYPVFDINLINSEKRKINLEEKGENIFEEEKNVIQLYGDSTKFDFSKIDFSMALIDGGHDYNTVKSDTLNIIRHIQKPGWIFWHDYDVINEVGQALTEFSNKLKIEWIKDTRLCFSYIDRDINL